MRIPIIKSTYTPRAQGSGQIATPMASTIGEGLQKIGKVAEVLYQDRANDMQEQIKANQIIAQSKWQNQMFETKKKLTENIDTAGDYASARDKWQAESEKIIGGIEKQKDLDPTWKESVIADLRRDQIQSDFQIGAAIKQRRKSEVAAAVDAQKDQLKRDMVYGDETTQAMAAKKLGGLYQGAEGAGAIPKGMAKKHISDVMGNVATMKSQMALQNGDFETAANIVENNKQVLSPERYVQLRGNILATQARIQKQREKETRLFTKLNSGAALSQSDADEIWYKATVKKQEIQTQAKEIGDEASAMQIEQQYNETLSNVIQQSGKLPTQMGIQIDNIMNKDPTSYSAQDVDSLVQTSRLVSQLPRKTVVNLNAKQVALMDAVSDMSSYQDVTKDDIRAIVSGIGKIDQKQMAEDISNIKKREADSWENVLRPFFMEETMQQDFATDIQSKNTNLTGVDLVSVKNVEVDKFKKAFGNSPITLKLDKEVDKVFEQAYMATKAGVPEDTAMDRAKQRLLATYDMYNYGLVKYGPKVAYGNSIDSHKEFEQLAVMPQLQKYAPANAENKFYQLVSDSQAANEYNSKRPVTYRIAVMQEDENGFKTVGLLQDSSGKFIRSKPLQLKAGREMSFGEEWLKTSGKVLKEAVKNPKAVIDRVQGLGL